jgi:hypothetical protein
MKYLIIIVITLGCSSIKLPVNQNEDYLILNEYLKDKNNISLIKENYFNGSTLRYFGMYKKWHKISIKNKANFNKMFFSEEQEWIFDNEDLKYMRKIHSIWVQSSWDKNKIGPSINLIDSKPNKYGMSPNMRISYPFYDKTKTKAMIVVSKSNGPLNGSTNIVLFKKNRKGEWKNVGELFVSIS